ADLAAQAGHQRALELALEVAADVLAELFRIAALDAEAIDETLVHFRQDRLGDLGRLDGHVHLAAGELRYAPTRGELDLDRLLLARLHPDQGGFDRREHRGRTDHGGAALGAFRREALAESGRASCREGGESVGLVGSSSTRFTAAML